MELLKITEFARSEIRTKPGTLLLDDPDGQRKHITLAYLERLEKIYSDSYNNNISLETKEILLRVAFEFVVKGIYIFSNKTYLKKKLISEVKALSSLAGNINLKKLVDPRILKKFNRYKQKKLSRWLRSYSMPKMVKRISTKRLLGRDFNFWYTYIYQLNSSHVHGEFLQLLMGPTIKNYSTHRVVEVLIVKYLWFLHDYYGFQGFTKELMEFTNGSIAYAESIKN